MQARAHLKLIVSSAPSEAQHELEQRDEVEDRVSMVQPLSSARLQWVRAHRQVLALWCASVVLLSIAAVVALGWL